MTLAHKPTNPTKAASANAIKKPAQQTRDSSMPAAQQTRASSVSAAASESFAPKRSNGSVAESEGTIINKSKFLSLTMFLFDSLD